MKFVPVLRNTHDFLFPTRTISYSEARQKLKNVMDSVFKDHKPVIVTRKKGENVIIMSQEDYDSLMETHYLLSSPANARHLLKSLDEANRGKTMPQDKIKL